jgi:ClpP class serine protease
MNILRFNESVVIDLDKKYYLIDGSENMNAEFLAILKFLGFYKNNWNTIDKNQMRFHKMFDIKNSVFRTSKDKEDEDKNNGLIFRRDHFIEPRLISQSNNYEELVKQMLELYNQNKYNL